MARKPGLGKGLGALIPEGSPTASEERVESPSTGPLGGGAEFSGSLLSDDPGCERLSGSSGDQRSKGRNSYADRKPLPTGVSNLLHQSSSEPALFLHHHV